MCGCGCVRACVLHRVLTLTLHAHGLFFPPGIPNLMAIWREKGSNRGRVASLVNSHMQVKKKWREKGSNRGRVASLVIVACREKKEK